ncbi:hypothetical protein [Flavobacterium algicola]|uniref:hypothetical protein n=1 Tax=Flavobacterium algicola TaxID=556529 RepID=UPI001EFE5E76|nr:hypothetical protein [Flavobacterium algicola]MCG9794005.1 hypothetical protein [Flavobacterium algicola]
MKKTILVLLLIVSQSFFGQELKQEYQQKIAFFIDCVKNNKKSEIATMISYPFDREYPLPKIKSKKEFVDRYDEIFDATFKKLIVQSNPKTDWSEVGWRGIMLNRGDMWIDTDGRIITINYQSKIEAEKIADIIKLSKKEVHRSLSNFVKPICIIETSRFRIRIDELDNYQYRYSSWSINQPMTATPDLVLNNGEFIREGTGGNHRYSFKRGNYIYDCYISVLGTKNSAPATLTVYKNEKEILRQDAKLLN